MAGRRWSQKDCEQLVEFHTQGMSSSDIAQHLNRTVKAVRMRLFSSGLRRVLVKVGDKFNRLTVISTFVKTEYNRNVTYLLCECECGNQTKQRAYAVKTSHVKSCGCLKNEIATARLIKYNYKHGKADLKVRLYRTWCSMTSRCRNKNVACYKHYGGRGISVCLEWRENYESFEQWALSNGYQEHLTIDRIDNDGNYCPENCRWATWTQQANNKSNNIKKT